MPQFLLDGGGLGWLGIYEEGKTLLKIKIEIFIINPQGVQGRETMSTRSNIIIDDGYDRIQIYRHWDGYPNGEWGVLGTLKEALPYAFEFPDFRAKEFASAIVRGWKAKEGNIYIDGSPDGWEMVHGDIEWGE